MTKEEKEIEEENWFLKAIKPTEAEKYILRSNVKLLRKMVDKEMEEGMEPSEAIIKCAKSILKRGK